MTPTPPPRPSRPTAMNMQAHFPQIQWPAGARPRSRRYMEGWRPLVRNSAHMGAGSADCSRKPLQTGAPPSYDRQHLSNVAGECRHVAEHVGILELALLASCLRAMVCRLVATADHRWLAKNRSDRTCLFCLCQGQDSQRDDSHPSG